MYLQYFDHWYFRDVFVSWWFFQFLQRHCASSNLLPLGESSEQRYHRRASCFTFSWLVVAIRYIFHFLSFLSTGMMCINYWSLTSPISEVWFDVLNRMGCLRSSSSQWKLQRFRRKDECCRQLAQDQNGVTALLGNGIVVNAEILVGDPCHDKSSPSYGKMGWWWFISMNLPWVVLKRGKGVGLKRGRFPNPCPYNYYTLKGVCI